MQKRLFQHTLIITVLLVLTLTGCTSIQARASSCQQMWVDTFSAQNRIPRNERRVLMILEQMSQSGIAPVTTGIFPCSYVESPCLWPGVTCTSGHVTQLDLSYRDLSGEIPAELENLTQLQELSLLNNQLSGEIPAELGNLTHLQGLYLADNRLSGEIPPELANLSQLENLFLDNNHLSGEIPPELSRLSQLRSLALNDNQLSGNIPPEFGNLTQLEYLSFSNNQLSGEIPPELGNLRQLWGLGLDNTQLSGPLPDGMIEISVVEFHLSRTELCIPQTPEFEAWMAAIDYNDFEDIPYCK